MIKLITNSMIKPKYIKQALDLDKNAYNDEYELSLQTCLEYFNKDNNIYSMLLDTNKDKIIGYINVSSINKESYDRLILGNSIDTFLTSEDLLIPSKLNDNYLYLSSIVIDKEYRNKGLSKLLLNSTGLKLEEYLNNKIYFKAIVADILNNKGERICKSLGLEFLKDSNHDSKIYYKNLNKENIKELILKLKK